MASQACSLPIHTAPSPNAKPLDDDDLRLRRRRRRCRCICALGHPRRAPAAGRDPPGPLPHRAPRARPQHARALRALRRPRPQPRPAQLHGAAHRGRAQPQPGLLLLRLRHRRALVPGHPRRGRPGRPRPHPWQGGRDRAAGHDGAHRQLHQGHGAADQGHRGRDAAAGREREDPGEGGHLRRVQAQSRGLLRLPRRRRIPEHGHPKPGVPRPR
ncbi:hypothetical protein ACQJBY_053927 [Aegilops geniculata]